MGMMELTLPCQQVAHVLPLPSGGPEQYLWEWSLTSVVPQRKETFFTLSGSSAFEHLYLFPGQVPSDQSRICSHSNGLVAPLSGIQMTPALLKM